MLAWAPMPPLAVHHRLALALSLALSGCAAVEVAPAPPPPPAPRRPVFATTGWAKPQEVRAGCVARAFVPPRAWKPRGKLVAKLAVGPDGRVVQFEDVSEPLDASGAVTTALQQAVDLCRFAPGRDPDGRPATIWLLLEVPVVSARR